MSLNYTQHEHRAGPLPKPSRPVSSRRQSESEEHMYKARYDYEAAREGDLSFTEGDILEIIGPLVGTWWLARNTRTGQEGYIPYNFIKKIAGISNSESSVSEQGRVFTAQRDYTSTFQGALAFSRNDKIEVLKEKDDNWVFGRLVDNGLEGLVPRSFLTQDDALADAPWYYGVTSREKAEVVLQQPHNQSGSFLVRDSTMAPAGYCLSVLCNKAVKHYLMHLNARGGVYISQQVMFDTVSELIQYYQTHDGLGTVRLSTPCESEPVTLIGGEGQWEITRSCLVPTGEVLGEGQFGQVYKALWNKATPVAVKEMKHGRGTPHDLSTLLSMAEMIISGMSYLEGEKVIHRDLAARNILVGNDLQVKIADFGLARFIKDDFYLRRSNVKFPVKWTAPEALINNLYTSKSDVWSFGILLYEIFTYGGNPYPGVSGKEARDLIQDGKVNRQPRECPDDVYSVMTACWKMNPHERPSFIELRTMVNTIKERVRAF
nr:tyrosine-protein kinase Src42A-like isoform X1 [Cherax quadricarinatus]XP_053637699.1 tyrosine-protein kinase Src42A-like isoform X1 [Cherax quadricarinatus]XP_053637700.1 tyrosine-protein kinase Src42A-like isoform X1 [Cherax quadricarinatus]